MWSRVALYKYVRYSLQRRRILGGRNLVRVRIVVAPSLILWQWKIGKSRNSNPKGRCEGERRNGGLAPFPPLFGFNMALSRAKTFARPKKTPALQATWDINQVFTTGRNFNYLSKGWFPLSRNFYLRTCVKFTSANKIEAMYEGSHVSVKVEIRSTSRLAQHLISCLYFYLFTWFKFTCVKYVWHMDVFIQAPLD